MCMFNRAKLNAYCYIALMMVSVPESQRDSEWKFLRRNAARIVIMHSKTC